jgi:hypothetical protein
MFAAGRSTRSSLERALDNLPPGSHAVTMGHDWIVAGPTGLFAVTGPEPDVAQAARRVAQTAAQLRSRLAHSLSWAPFVDALVVVDAPSSSRAEEASVIPVRLLHRILTEGRPHLEHHDVDQIVAEVDQL